MDQTLMLVKGYVSVGRFKGKPIKSNFALISDVVNAVRTFLPNASYRDILDTAPILSYENLASVPMIQVGDEVNVYDTETALQFAYECPDNAGISYWFALDLVNHFADINAKTNLKLAKLFLEDLETDGYVVLDGYYDLSVLVDHLMDIKQYGGLMRHELEDGS